MSDAILPGGEWEAVRVIAVDAATIGIGDAGAMVLASDRLLEIDRELGSENPVQDFTERGIPLITMNTGEDGGYTVETARDGEGTLLAVRVEITDDVAEVPGRWRTVGMIEVTSGSLVVTDPYCHGEAYSAVLPAPNGQYAIDIFEMNDEHGQVTDHLGIRARFEGRPSMPKRR